MFIHPHRWQCLFILTNGNVYSPRPVTIPFFPHLPVILELVMYLKTNGNYWWCLSPTRENWVMISSPEGNTVKVFDIGGNRCSWLSWRIVIVTTTTRTVMTDCIYVCVLTGLWWLLWRLLLSAVNRGRTDFTADRWLHRHHRQKGTFSTAPTGGFVTSVGKRCALPLITVFLVTKTLLSTQFNVNSNVCCMLLSNWNSIDSFRRAWTQGLCVCSRVGFLFEFQGND